MKCILGIALLSLCACSAQVTETDEATTQQQSDQSSAASAERRLDGAGPFASRIYIRETEGPGCPEDVDFTVETWWVCTARHPSATIYAHTDFQESATNVLNAANRAVDRCRTSVVSMGGWDPDQCHVTSCFQCK